MNTRNSYNRNSNQYQSSRYNNPGTFVPAVQTQAQQGQYSSPQSNQNLQPVAQHPASQGWLPDVAPLPAPPAPPSLKPVYQQQQHHQQEEEEPAQEMDMDGAEGGEAGEDTPGRKKWMKKGFKVSMRERRRRQNKQLRRLITPKNALMVLNELTPDSRHECTVLPEAEAFTGALPKQYVAMLNVEGIEYRGTGPSKLQAKNNAAEGVIRDMIIKQMGRFPEANQAGDEDVKMGDSEDDKAEGEPTFPMIQLASYALHKLFTDWQTGGFKVPQLVPAKPPSTGASETGSVASAVPGAPKAPRKAPALPPAPAALHPCVLLSQMRGALNYSFLACETHKPNAQVFSMGVTVDGTTYIGKASNKKEARKLAAQRACEDIFKIVYPDDDKKVPIEDM